MQGTLTSLSEGLFSHAGVGLGRVVVTLPQNWSHTCSASLDFPSSPSRHSFSNPQKYPHNSFQDPRGQDSKVPDPQNSRQFSVPRSDQNSPQATRFSPQNSPQETRSKLPHSGPTHLPIYFSAGNAKVSDKKFRTDSRESQTNSNAGHKSNSNSQRVPADHRHDSYSNLRHSHLDFRSVVSSPNFQSHSRYNYPHGSLVSHYRAPHGPHILIDAPHPVWGERPYTQQSGSCGSSGDFIRLTHRWLNGSDPVKNQILLVRHLYNNIV